MKLNYISLAVVFCVVTIVCATTFRDTKIFFHTALVCVALIATSFLLDWMVHLPARR